MVGSMILALGVVCASVYGPIGGRLLSSYGWSQANLALASVQMIGVVRLVGLVGVAEVLEW